MCSYNPVSLFALFISYISTTVLRRPLNALDVESGIRNFWRRLVVWYQDAVWMLRAKMAYRIFTWSRQIAPMGIDLLLTEAALIPAVNWDSLEAKIEPPLLPESIPQFARVVLQPQVSLPVADFDAVPHTRHIRLSKDKKRTDYKPVKDIVPGIAYWYKSGKKWQQMIAPARMAA